MELAITGNCQNDASQHTAKRDLTADLLQRPV